uniref:Putative serine/threonine protein kinase n=1 Tax=Marseillevirus LCMAC201 TaxID=2506605 RepID=A0A481YW67_9VIRU|nr:MAG: putative serine/threonine protein kinase [Marseillevirus LCMAC201]
MEKLKIKGNVILWMVGTQKWLITFEELNHSYVCNRHPHTNKQLSRATQNKIIEILRGVASVWWISTLKKMKNYHKIPLSRLSLLKKLGTKLGSGKYASVYRYNSYAVKVINHRFYKNLPRIDGKLEAKILTILRDRITYALLSPNIIGIYQYTQDKKTDYIVLEKLDRTFWDYLQSNPKERIVKGIILQVLFSITILQHVLPGFRHNDLKVDNILLDFTQRKKITLRYKGYYWILPSDIPLVKIADFDYAYIPKLCNNPKVGTGHARSFGCTKTPSKIYDTHLFLNSLYSYRHNLSPILQEWLQQLPKETRGNENTGVKFGRLRIPEKWEKKIRNPLYILVSRFFSEFRITQPMYPMWGLAV